MAYVMAQQNKWASPPQFVEAGGLNDLIGFIQERKADVFLWETMMLRSSVRAGKLREVGLLPTPWPCFHVAVTDLMIEEHPHAIRRLLACLTSVASTWSSQVPI